MASTICMIVTIKTTACIVGGFAARGVNVF